MKLLKKTKAHTKPGEKFNGRGKKNKYNSFEQIRPILLDIIEENNGNLPSKDRIDKLAKKYDKYKGINYFICYLGGGFSRIRNELNLEVRHYKNWSLSEVQATLYRLEKQYKSFPTIVQLENVKGLRSAVASHGGLHKISETMHIKPNNKKKYYWRNKENCITELQNIADKMGIEAVDLRQRDLVKLKRYDIISGIYFSQGTITDFIKDNF